MKVVLIYWCGNPDTVLRRIVLGPDLPEAPGIRAAAEKLGIPVVEPNAELQAHDLWIGCGPKDGWGDLAGVTMWARSCEACLIPGRLAEARTITVKD